MNKLNVKLIVGLGNPDPAFERTYHNVGHLFLDYFLNSKFPPAPPAVGFGRAGEIRNSKSFKSDTFMNQSGAFVKKAVREHKVKPEQVLIVHDDADIELGKFKLSFGRGSAGHKGVQNVISQLKTNAFWRLRVGIRPRRNKDKADELVLKKITPARMKTLQTVFQEAAERLTLISEV